MTDRPIIFSAPMVLALLAGRKTQTRRLATSPLRRCEAGDRLWVREAWATVNSCEGPGFAYRADGHFSQPEFDGHDYGAGPSFDYDKYPGSYTMWYSDLLAGAEGHGWTPSIHMPRWASRLTLIVEAVRVQPLQEISEDDAIAEGAAKLAHDGEGHFFEHANGTFVCGYAGLWEHLHGSGSWDANPEVVAIAFSVERRNIDR